MESRKEIKQFGWRVNKAQNKSKPRKIANDTYLYMEIEASL
jgi:hypothetical protein